MTAHPGHPDPRRAEWLSVLARADADGLASLTRPVLADHAFDWLRRPEVGLWMVRARIGGDGERFNVGEVTVTRCAVRTTHAGRTVVGVGHVLGRSPERAALVARVDALMQLPDLRDLVEAALIAPLRDRAAAREADRTAMVATTRVAFETMEGASA